MNAILARNERPGAVGLVVTGRRGVEMELRLPDAGTDEVVDATSPLPPVGPWPTPHGPDAGRPPRGPRSRFRQPLLIGGGVFALRSRLRPRRSTPAPSRPACDPIQNRSASSLPRTPNAPAPDPAPVAAAAEPEASSGCHTSYSPFLPDGPDLDCGDIDGPVTVTGPDEYRLDREGDGIGCES